MSESVKLKAIDVKPNRWALWCAIGDGKPFANPICLRRWSEDGQHIWFMLDSHNFYKAAPDEEIEVLPCVVGDIAKSDAQDAEKMAVRPCVCPTYGARKPEVG